MLAVYLSRIFMKTFAHTHTYNTLIIQTFATWTWDFFFWNVSSIYQDSRSIFSFWKIKIHDPLMKINTREWLEKRWEWSRSCAMRILYFWVKMKTQNHKNESLLHTYLYIYILVNQTELIRNLKSQGLPKFKTIQA